MKIQRTVETVHPILIKCIKKIQTEVLDQYKIPIKLFETGRTHERHTLLFKKGKTKEIMSAHLFNLDNDPPLYTTAIDYVYYDSSWSWNLRDSTISAWYILFGNLVLDLCPELSWRGFNRKNVNFCHFELRQAVIVDNLDKFPCVTF